MTEDTTDIAKIEALFTRSEGGYRFARWGRPMAPVVMGTEAPGEALLLDALRAVSGLTGMEIAEEDPEFGRNLLIFMVDRWPRLLEIESLPRLVPDIERLVGVLGATGANQYRIFDFDGAGAIRLCITLLRLDDDMARMPPRAFALSQAAMGLLLWSDRAFLGESPVAMTESGRAILTPFHAGVVRAAYAPDLPVASADRAHAGEMAARLG